MEPHRVSASELDCIMYNIGARYEDMQRLDARYAKEEKTCK